MSDEITNMQKLQEPSEETVPQVHLVACDPQEMAASQANLTVWVKQKVAAVKYELEELTTAYDTATKNGWDSDALERQVDKAALQVTYYEKMLGAVEAGFTIIPNFPIDLFAIRVSRNLPAVRPEQGNSAYWWPTLADEKAQALAAGEGRYVSPTQRVRNEEHRETKDGKEIIVRTVTPTSFGEVEFPLIAARPVVMDAAHEAMALQLFDQIGICPKQTPKGDPLIIGQIFLPPVRSHTPRKLVSFLIAWHLNLNDL
jgi:hypothetical protein